MKRIVSICKVVVAVALCGAGAAHAATPTVVHVGIANASSDVAFFIADKKGYFRAEGIDARFVPFDSGAKMVAPLGAGQLDVAGGSPSAGLYNAVMRGIGIKIVADKGSTPPGYGYQPLLVRKDLVASGRYKTLADLKGMKVAGSATGSASTSTMNEALKKAGLKPGDVERIYLGFPQHVMALENKAVDAALTTEPSATEAVRSGAAVRVMGDDQIYPNHQLAVVLYSNTFIHDHPATAKAFMRAYLRAVRDYNDALKDGKIAGPNADEVIAILTQYTSIKDPSVYRTIVPQGTNPDGKVNIASLENDLAYFRSQGVVKGNVSVAQVVDTSFVDQADAALGPYQPRAK
ncbi:ABC transporter substrate-binding protein [Paraburkholderia panacisoli]|uniref:ABC transporter substrate-binding protein n=1 Tax=Paraburkholderia panacisoli TaxID=2603818 RepID=UPI001FED1BD7|nr:ABC transporter substrate-binding protein [Paraburkholderia panacisoli]